VDKSDFSPVQPPRDPSARELTLTSCHPKGSAKQRIIVKARFIRDGAAAA